VLHSHSIYHINSVVLCCVLTVVNLLLFIALMHAIRLWLWAGLASHLPVLSVCLSVSPLQVTWSLWLIIVTGNFEVRQVQAVVFLVFCFANCLEGLRKCVKNYGNNRRSKQPIICRRHGAESLTCWRHDTISDHCSGRLATVMLLYSPVVTICTTNLTFSNSTFCLHSVFMCFVWISEQTAIISLYNTKWLVCVNEI
jgi:hypothetical protein